MSRPSLTIEQVLSLLVSAPARIETLSADLTAVQLRTSPTPGEWSANEVLAHLRSCADVWGGCIATIVRQDKPTLRAVNPTTWIKQTDYPDQDFHRSLQAFAAQRSELLAILNGLPPEGWSRSATITGAGSPLEYTVLTYGQRLAVHERTHLKQIASITNTLRRNT